MRAAAIHLCADVLATEPYARWAKPVVARDTIAAIERLCRGAGIDAHHRLIGEAVTRAAVVEAITGIDADFVVVSFCGHTERGAGPIESTAWCLVDGTLSVAAIAAAFAQLPPTTTVLVVADTCYASAITHVITGPQRCVVLAACGDAQGVTERVRSELVSRLDAALARDPRCTLATLRDALVADTPDAERPEVWTNTPALWNEPAMASTSPEAR